LLVDSSGSHPVRTLRRFQLNPALPARDRSRTCVPPVRFVAPRPFVRADDGAYPVAPRGRITAISRDVPPAFRSPSPVTGVTGFGLGALNVLFGVLRLAACPAIAREAPSVGFLPSSRRQPTASTRARIPLHALVRPWRFPRLRRFPPRSALRVCFAPLPCPGFSLQGFVPPHGAVRRRRRRCPPVVGSRRLRLPAPAPRSSTPRLCSPCGVRWIPEPCSPVNSAPLLGFSSSGCCFPHRLKTSSRLLRLRRFPR